MMRLERESGSAGEPARVDRDAADDAGRVIRSPRCCAGFVEIQMTKETSNQHLCDYVDSRSVLGRALLCRGRGCPRLHRNRTESIVVAGRYDIRRRPGVVAVVRMVGSGSRGGYPYPYGIAPATIRNGRWP